MRDVSLARATLHDGQTLLAFNDFFLGAKSHVSARYQLRVGHRSEEQSSSGILVSTGAGSTGWMSSVFNMAHGVAGFVGTQMSQRIRKMKWEDRSLLWAVREPFISQTSRAGLVMGSITEGEELVVESLMPSGGVIFSDGVESDFLEFNGGTIARLTVAAQARETCCPLNEIRRRGALKDGPTRSKFWHRDVVSGQDAGIVAVPSQTHRGLRLQPDGAALFCQRQRRSDRRLRCDGAQSFARGEAAHRSGGVEGSSSRETCANSDYQSIVRGYSRAAGVSETVDSGWPIFLWWGALFLSRRKTRKMPQAVQFLHNCHGPAVGKF